LLLSITTITFEQGLAYALLALAVYLSFRTLNFPDLTVDGSFPLGGAVAATLMVGGTNPFVATLAAVGAGLVAGTFTGLLNTKLKINPLLSGILTMIGLYSINLAIMGRSNISLLRIDSVFDKIANVLGVSASTTLVILTFAVLVTLIIIILARFLHTNMGLAIRATGDNSQMIRGLGVDTDKTKIVGLSLSNGLVALSGALVAQDQGFTDVGMGIGMIIIGLASVIIGESLFRPKTVTWTLVSVAGGSIVYRLFVAVALRLGMAPGMLKLVTALLVIAVLAAPRYKGMWQQIVRWWRRDRA
jgi:putative ABC transport system permease protein